MLGIWSYLSSYFQEGNTGIEKSPVLDITGPV